MKKIGTVLSIFVLAALALAACGGGGTGNTTPGAITTPGAGEGGGLTTGTPGAGLETGTPASGAATATVPAAGGVTGTPEAGAATPTAGAELTGTPAAGTTTPVAGVPVTGEHQFALLSQVLKARVETGSTGSAAGGTQELGTVYGVVINSLAASPGTGTDTGVTATAAPGATATAAPGVTTTPTTGTGADTTATPASGAGAGTDTGSDTLTGPAISYLLVNANAAGAGSDAGTGAGAATSTPGADTGSATATPGADTATTTPTAGSAGSGASPSVAGQVVAIPWGAVNASMSTGFGKSGAGETVLVVTVDTDAVAGAPAFDDSAVTGADWDAEIASYWAGKGLTIPVTGGTANLGQPVVIRGSLPNMNVTGADGKVLGQVRDFVVDLTTGQLSYAVLSGGSTFGGNFYLVPLTVFTWQAGQGQGQGQGNSLGDFTTSIPTAIFQSAPNLAALDELDLSAADWNMLTDQYWTGQGATK